MTISRRDFLKLVGGTAITSVFHPVNKLDFFYSQNFPEAEHLGRLTATINYHSEPRIDDYTLLKTQAFEDDVVVINREVVASAPDFNFPNIQRWFETPKGYLFAGYVQPVKNQPNEPLKAILDNKAGFWAEVTVPYADLLIDNPPPRAPWTKDIIGKGGTPRLYFSQVVWIDQIKMGDTNQILYRFEENGGRPPGATGGSYGDIFWANANAFRPLTVDDVSPIHPAVDPNTKKINVDTTRNMNTVTCMEGKDEVYFCRCSPGAKFNSDGNLVDNWTTVPGDYITQWKTISIHMSGGSTGAGYDTPAVSWANFFDSQHGMAIHAAFWHNMFGEQVSHGCVNVAPEDAKWIFRWTYPQISLENLDVRKIPDGTHVLIKERIY